MRLSQKTNTHTAPQHPRAWRRLIYLKIYEYAISFLATLLKIHKILETLLLFFPEVKTKLDEKAEVVASKLLK